MFYVLNFLLIAIIVLIAYWWANQGLFSALLHLLCVIVAGALALALWEPLTLGLVMRGSAFDDYAWGVVLISVFVIALLGLRVACDKLVPANVDLPHWANLAFGLPVGLAAGYLTVGLLVIGIGHIPTQRDIMDVNGWQRGNNGQVAQVEGQPFWCQALQITTWFYDWVSDGAFSTSTPLRTHDPELYKQATLLRDGFTDTKGQLVSRVVMLPDAVQVLGVFKSTEARSLAVRVKIDRLGFDGGGQQLVLSASQIRLIFKPRGRGDVQVVYPNGFAEQDSATSIGFFRFDSQSNYVTSVPGKESAELLLIFPLPQGDPEPKFLQIRGTRFTLPAIGPQNLTRSELDSMKFTLGRTSQTDTVTSDRTKSTVTAEEIEIASGLRVYCSVNALPGGISTERQNDRYTLFQGKADFSKSQERAPTSLLVDRIYETEGTRIVQLDVSRLTTADVFGFARREKLGDNVTPMLVDSTGSRYRAIGYIHDHGNAVTIRLDRQDNVGTIHELPELPSSGSETLKLIFEVTSGVDVTAFSLNNVVVANINLHVTPVAGRVTAPVRKPEEDVKPPAK